MHETEQAQFTAVAEHYDVLMRDVPYRDWVDHLDRIFARFELSPGRILDLACGTGTVSELLAARGKDVVGVDVAEPMIRAARRKAARRGLDIVYHVQDAARLCVPGPPFDACVSLFDSLNYVADPPALASAICRVFAHLQPGGLFVFDVNSEYALANSFFDQDNLESDDRLRYVWRSEYDPDSRLCRVHMRFFLRHADGVDREFRETHVQYAYREDELRAMLADAGFDPIDTFHAYTLRPVRATTDRIFFAARKPVPPQVTLPG